VASIVYQKVGNNTYLYESTSYRGKDGKPRNKRTIVGKIDKKTGNPIFKPEYIERMQKAGTPVAAVTAADTFSGEEIRNSIIKEVGAFYLYKGIAEKTGLLEILKDTFPENWRDIFDLACYMVSTGEPLMYCEQWLSKTEAFEAELSSPQVSRLLQSISHEEQERFFHAWGTYRREREYLALDITSVSSYSEFISAVEWGYNRDGERLPQVNLCLLLGEQSRLPVFQMRYNGSIKDVATLKTSLSMAFSIGQNRLTLVMDKGFYSQKNLNSLLQGPFKGKFIIALPFTVTAAKELVKEFRSTIDTPDYAIALSEYQSIQGVMKKITWNKEQNLYAHVYYNLLKAAEVKSSLYGHVASLIELAKANPEDIRYAAEFDQYLHIKKSAGTGGYRITIRHEVVEAEYSHAGWMVLLSNHQKNPEKALNIYRAKDAVEKGFYRLKNDLDFHRLRIHSDTAMHSKMFIGFIALIIMSHIHLTMTNLRMYKSWTLKELIKELEKLHVQYIAGNRILHPVSKTQKELFHIFGLEPPM
jgi:transposase